ncbi:uncharacterized protein [Leishmania mexicana MHOM/GT/2001/U1103]|uniref:Uncharacterized protein n=1 Tax=Leishmania mexicana (strain MHOM/GT/2001/U1103) TaxID=929439 RepID=E8NHL0_LEIMU|nr:uncharacterized protein [Leishmania mexicana MHOM/GT/2001/U1103]CBZ40985.1 unnamed protein product [Leishmania mexicana MHOM/GT/2001/U1103]
MSETAHRVRTLRAGGRGHAGVLRRGDAVVKRSATCTLPMDGDEVELSVGARAHDPHDPRDAEAIALILLSRGWRVERLRLLGEAGLSPCVFASKLERGSTSERAQRVREGSLRRALAQHKGTTSCISGVSAVRDVFTTNRRDVCVRPVRGRDQAFAYAQHTVWAPSAPAAPSTSSERAAAPWRTLRRTVP